LAGFSNRHKSTSLKNHAGNYPGVIAEVLPSRSAINLQRHARGSQ
jgi:hypothetical protein